MLKGILNKGFVKYSLGLIILILCVFSLIMYVRPTSGKISDTGLMTGNDDNGEHNGIEVLDFYENGVEPQAPPQNDNDSGNSGSGSSGSGSGSSSDSSGSFASGFGGGGGGGGGTVQCVPKHLECRDEQCILVSGTGSNKCATDTDCDTHTECDESDACIVVQGGGEDQCVTYEDCAEHYICDYNTFTCEKRPLSQQGDECEVVVGGNLTGKAPNLAKLNDNTNVTSNVRVSDNVYATQSVGTNPAYIYLFWNFNIPSEVEINNATLSIEHKESSATVAVEWWNGSSYVEVCDPPEYAVDTISTCDLSPYITTPQKANEIKIRLKYMQIGNCHGDVDWAYLEIGYSEHEFLDCFEKICDYENQTCKKVIPGTQGEACETYADCQMCGNDEVENGEECDDGVNNGVPCTPPYGGSCTYCNATCGNATLTDGRCGDEVVQQGYEQCELPGTENNVFCLQTTQNCSGKKLGTRDAYGNCTSECGCTYDSFVYYCIKGQCGAGCAINSDCDDQNPNTVDTCNLETCSCEHETQPYCGDGNVSGSEQCELPNTNNNSYCIQNTSQCQPSGRKLGTRDAYGDCGGSCGCTYDPFVYKCVKDVCGAECDLDSGCPDYCDGSVKHTGRTCGWCSTCLCSNGNEFDCNSLDGWYDTGSKQWISTGECSEKEQKEQKYRNYNCGTSPAMDCYYTENGTKWVDTGQTRNKPNGTGCNDGLWCTDNDVCTAGSCGGGNKDCSDGLECTDDSCDETHDTCVNTPDDSECDDGLWCNGEETCDVELGCIDGTTVNCSDNNIPEIARCDNVPDANPYTWDYGVGFISECDEASDICTQGNQNLTHTCSVLNCSAQCDATHGCANSTCSQTYNDYCNTTKLVEYDSDKVKDSTTVNGSCQNSCRDNCTCTNCTASCSPPPTNTYCVKGVCNASCAVNSDCTCQPDGCIGKDYYDYPVHGACTDGCSCEQGSCTPSISYNDPRCSHKVCDYQLQACAVVNGTGSNECATWEDCEYCGNGNVEPPEQCELPNTNNNSYCIQNTSQCQPSGRKLGTRDAYGDCGGSCGCTYDPFVYKCVKDVCGAECDLDSGCPDYCDGSVKHTGRTCGWCSTCLCSNGNEFDCNSLDGWYDTGSKQWVGTGDCTEKEQKEQKYRDYNCGTSPAVDCYYTETGTKWVDTGETRNKPDGTGCSDGLWCTDNDVCTAGSCGGSNKDCSDELECTHDSCDETHDMCVNTPDDSECNDGLWCNGEETCDIEIGCVDGTAVDCSDNNISEIARCDNVPDSNPYTWDYGAAFISECDEASDRCTQGDQNLTHTCSVANCQAECDSDDDCECQQDGCVGSDWYNYPEEGICLESCACDEGACAPNISYNDPRCSHKVCDYQLQACSLVEGAGANQCSTWQDCQFCGNSVVELPEQCELPNTANNTYCLQSTSECSGKKLGTRDAYGNCNSGCGCNYDPFTYKCVKGQCGAQCAVNSDCKCQQQDGCVGIDYYDYPDYTTCNGNCACGECSPTIIECDSRCIGNCKVEVKSGHDMNPRWGYPYTATDDIWIMATDVSNGACSGLTFDITYWWCSCPSQTPSQSSIEVTQKEWSAKYDRLCSADAANYGGTNPTHSLECADCGVRMYHPSFPADSGKKFWTGVGSCEGTFQIDLRPGCYDIGYVPALACAGQCEDHPIIKHAECSNMQCIEVVGAGADQCTADADCYYNECDWTHMICVKTAGNLADECTTNADCATHYECTDYYTCERVPGAGINQCSPAKPTDCGMDPRDPLPLM